MPSSWRPPLTTLAITSAAATLSYCLYHSVSKYGWEGTCWYVWEGSPYPPVVRQEFSSLDQIERSLKTESRSLDRLEEAYERAKLNSVDGATSATIISNWDTHVQNSYKKPKNAMTLEKLLAKISYNLDQCAAKVDAVPSKKHKDLKSRKKVLSNEIVKLMARADTYLELFKEAQRQQQ